jgi:nicotinamidase-related amidase
MTKVLLIIDVQNDYFAGGRMELVGSEAAALQASRVLAHFREQGQPVIHVQHVALSPTATFFLPGTPGVEINSAVAPVGDELVVVKHRPNAFRDTQLKQVLDGLSPDELVVAGMMTQMCIDTTVRAASDYGFAVTLVGDACATRDLEFNGSIAAATDVQTAYLAALDGSFATVVSAEDFILRNLSAAEAGLA